MEISLCEFDGQLYKCKGESNKNQKGCKFFEKSKYTNRCAYCKNTEYKFICDCDEAKKEIKK